MEGKDFFKKLRKAKWLFTEKSEILMNRLLKWRAL